MLSIYPWPGNVRELSNEMERAAALTVDTVIRPSDLSPKLLAALARHGCIKTSATAPREPLPDIRTTFNLEQAERLLVQRALDACQGNKSRAAELLGITREGLRKKLLRQLHATIDDAIDKAGLPLLGVVPEDDALPLCMNRGVPILLADGQSAATAYRNIAKRLQGERVPLLRIR